MTLRRAVFLSLVLLSSLQLYAQSNTAIDTLLGQEKAAYAETRTSHSSGEAGYPRTPASPTPSGSPSARNGFPKQRTPVRRWTCGPSPCWR
jgi:hypothetical protein